ncbi:SIR2 family NAD-dependent protein deacylase [Alicyclobacillus cellulosilyticus]|nr:Sir2 family NAD-dependent protein deacetylase [Alicyclobacillus cellulosilyticus]
MTAEDHVVSEGISTEEFAHLQAFLRVTERVVVITGAGISRASGLPLGHDRVDGVPLEIVFEPRFFQEDPVRFYALYRHLLTWWQQAVPNAAHVAIAKRGAWVITQNIDGLHRRAGSSRVIELHGNLRELRCGACGQIYRSDLVFREPVPRCRLCGRLLSPGFTMEGQPVRHFARAVDWVGQADALLVIGTQLAKEPVRRLPEIARRNRRLVVWINEEAEVWVPRLFDIPRLQGRFTSARPGRT